MQVLAGALRRWVAVVGGLAAAVVACSSEPGDPRLRMLPANHEVQGWVRTEATLVTTESELYNQIDGAAPKYIDSGWQNAVFASYGQGEQSVQVSISDMGSADNAQAIFNRYLPPSKTAIAGLDNAVVDLGFSTAYSAYASVERYYVEVSIDDRSDAALASVKAFVLAIAR